jgi:hypothetical protein
MNVVLLGGLLIIVTAIGHRVRGFKPGRIRWILKVDKISHYYHYHHQWHHSPINEPWPLLEFFCRRFSTNLFLQSEVVSLTPNPQPGGPDHYLQPADRPSYTTGHWVARVPRDCQIPYPLTWAPEEREIFIARQSSEILRQLKYSCSMKEILLG